MRKLVVVPALEAEFATVEAVWHSGGTTRRVDALLLSWVKYEKQLRRLFCFLVYQHPRVTEATVESMVSAMVENNKLYPDTYIKGINELRGISIRELMGKRYDALLPEIRRIKGYRNKLMHGQITGKKISSRQIEKDVVALLDWISTLASAAESRLGYDGVKRNTYRAAKATAHIAVSKYPFDDSRGFKKWLRSLVDHGRDQPLTNTRMRADDEASVDGIAIDEGEVIDAAEVGAAIAALTDTAAPSSSNDVRARSGVYAIRIKHPGPFSSILEDDCDLLYIGMSTDLAEREFDTHFDSTQTGFSTVRRSIGSILKDELKLTACARGRGRSRTDFTNFRFDPKGEERLTAWMRQHLSVRTWATDRYESLERALILRLRPPLNLEKCNPKNDLIRKLRKSCADEARGTQSAMAESALQRGRDK